MPNPIRVDVTPPRIESFTARPPVISPDGDGRFDRAKIRYRVSERSVVELYVDGMRALRRLGTRTTGTMDWFGVVGGEPLPQGSYTLRLVARDVAGNLGPRSGSRTVAIRFLALGRDRVVTTPGSSFAILAISQARILRWTLAGRSGDRPSRHPPAPRPGRAGAVRPPGRRQRARRARRRRRPRGAGVSVVSAAVSVASQIAGVVGALGLAVAARSLPAGRRGSPASSPGPPRSASSASTSFPTSAGRGSSRRRWAASSSRSPSPGRSDAGPTSSLSRRSPASRSACRWTSGATRSTSCCRSTR